MPDRRNAFVRIHDEHDALRRKYDELYEQWENCPGSIPANAHGG